MGCISKFAIIRCLCSLEIPPEDHNPTQTCDKRILYVTNVAKAPLRIPLSLAECVMCQANNMLIILILKRFKPAKHSLKNWEAIKKENSKKEVEITRE
jgi:hypothetical protein